MKPSLLRQATQKSMATPRHIISLEEEIQARVDMVEAEGQIEKTTAEIDHAQDAIGALEDLAMVCDKIEKPSATEAALIQITGDALAAGTDADPADLTPSMESEESGQGMVARIKEAVRKIFEAIKQAMAKLWAWIKKFFGAADKTIDAEIQKNDEVVIKVKTQNAEKKSAPPARKEKFFEVEASNIFDRDMTCNDLIKRITETTKAVKMLEDAHRELHNGDYVTGVNYDHTKDSGIVGVESGKARLPGRPTPEPFKEYDNGLKIASYVLELPALGLLAVSRKIEGSVQEMKINEFWAMLEDDIGNHLFELLPIETAHQGTVKISYPEKSGTFDAMTACTSLLKQLRSYNETVIEKGVKRAEDLLKKYERDVEEVQNGTMSDEARAEKIRYIGYKAKYVRTRASLLARRGAQLTRAITESTKAHRAIFVKGLIGV